MSDTAFSPEVMNALFTEAVQQGGDALNKLAENTGLYVQRRLRENSFARRILPPQSITPQECQRSENSEGLAYVDDVEPDSIAMRINWRGEPEKTYITAPRYTIRFHTISSDKFTKTEQELRSYRMPLTQVIEQNTIRDIQEQEDVTFMAHVQAALWHSTLFQHDKLVDLGLLAAGEPKGFADGDAFYRYLFQQNSLGGAWAALAPGDISFATGAHANLILTDEEEFTRTVLRDLVNVPTHKEIEPKTFLLHQVTWNDTLAWSLAEAGLEITSEIVRDGYKYTTIGGYTFVTTIRENRDIVQPGQIYVFPSPQFLGRFLILENTRFFIDKRGRFIEMEAWEDVAMGFGNMRGIGCILLRGAEVSIPVAYGTPGPATFGTQRVINDPTIAAVPALT